jgi:hypothetical protein
MSRLSGLLTLKRRLGTAFALMSFGRKTVAGSPHEPLPDMAFPGLCGIDGLDLDDPLHQRRRKPRCCGDPAAKAGWR